MVGLGPWRYPWTGSLRKKCFALIDSSLLEYYLTHKQNYYPLEMIHGTGHTDIKDDYGKEESKKS